MEESRYVSYADWIALIAVILEKGMTCQEFEQIKQVYPQTAGESHISMVYNELGRLEECLLMHSFSKFQNTINRCLEEMDLEIAEFAMRNLRRNLKDCLFFNDIPEFPESIKNKMTQEVKKNIEAFQEKYQKYLKKLAYSDSSVFVQDLIYMCKKRISVC